MGHRLSSPQLGMHMVGQSSSEPRSSSDESTEAPPVVGIGASAGGLQALEVFFDALPTDTGMAFVVLMHLSPDHESNLSEILQHHTDLAVRKVDDGVQLMPNTVYVMPPRMELGIEDGRLQQADVTQRHDPPRVIDTFFRALAADQEERAIGIILSGTGSDGTKGIAAIKERGGFTMVQEPTEAVHDSMPRQAIQTDLIDVVAPVGTLAADLVRYWNHAVEMPLEEPAEDLPEEEGRVLHKILAHVYAETEHDFSNYKRSTILRRIARRLTVHHVQTLDEYLSLLRRDGDEVKALFREFLISVTSFFRDPDAFEALEESIIPKLFKGKEGNEQVRVWSIGCATGEEVYSLAMLLYEQAADQEHAPDIQIFATDSSEGALEKAREGLYPENVISDLTPEQVKRYLVPEGEQYRMRRELRDMILFANHNLLEDPPFSKIDLISCRNLLIYLNRTMQEHVFKLIHYALRPGGYLFLGASESVAAASGLFSEVNHQQGLYKRRPTPTTDRGVPLFPLQKRLGQGTMPNRGAEHEPENPESVSELHRRLLAEEVASIVVDEEYNIVHLTDRAARYLGYKGGAPTHNVLEAVPRALRMELRSGLYQVFKKDETSTQERVQVDIQGVTKHMNVRIRPAGEVESFAQIILTETEPPETNTDFEAEPEDSDKYVAHLEEELKKTKDQLQATVEEYETTTEEMEASNEELLSLNEELQSQNEEIETSKEELQSVNEELETTNQELKNKIDELRRTNSDLQNLMKATDIATLFLDRELCIKRLTPRVKELFNVREDDVGRPLSDFSHNLGYESLLEDAREVIEGLQPIERELKSEDDRWFLVQFRPYRTLDDRIDGVVITFVDITELKTAQREAEREREYAQEIVDTVREPLVVLDEDLRVESVNSAFHESFHINSEKAAGTLLYELGNGQWDIPELRTLLNDILREREPFEDFRVEHDFDEVGHRVMELNARRIDHKELILLAINDITDYWMAETLREERNFVESLLQTVGALVVVMDVEGQIIRFNRKCEAVTGYAAEEVIGENVFELLIAPSDQEGVRAVIDEHKKGVEHVYHENEWVTKDGDRRLIRWSSTVLRDDEGRIKNLIGTGIDITERRELERELLSISDKERRRIGQDLHDLLASQLAGTSMMAQSVATRMERGEEVELDRMHKVVELINSSGEQARALSHMLMPLEVHGESLINGLDNLAAREEKMTDITCTFTADEGVPECDTEVSAHLYRIATEALHNAVKHGKPDQIDLRLNVEDDRLVLTVSDDGCGIDPDAGPSDGIGLRMMEYRANLVGGALDIKAADGGGTRVRCSLPLSKATEGASASAVPEASSESVSSASDASATVRHEGR